MDYRILVCLLNHLGDGKRDKVVALLHFDLLNHLGDGKHHRN